jgi:hypothetical protein
MQSSTLPFSLRCPDGVVTLTGRQPGNCWRDLEKRFLAHVALQKHYEMTRGCPFGTLGNEATENDELIRQDVSLIFEVVKNKLAAFFMREKANGPLSRRPMRKNWLISALRRFKAGCC